MSSPTPSERATAARRLDFVMRDVELAEDWKTINVTLRALREQVDAVNELLTR